MMATTTLFLSNRSQAVRLPKEVAFPAEVHEVRITKEGNRRIITPFNSSWDDFFDALGVDLGSRDQPTMQERESF